MTSRISVDDLRFHYWQGGAGEDVVLVHGIGANLALWHFTLAAELIGHHHLTMYDLRGHGRSDRPPTGYTAQDMVVDLVGILDGLGLGRVNLIGHSFGADIALRFAQQHPERVRRIVAIEASVPTLTDMRHDRNWQGWDEWRELLSRECGLRLTPDEWHVLYTQLARGESVPELGGPTLASSRKAKQMADLLTSTSLIRDYEQDHPGGETPLADLSCPVLLVYGERSHYLPAREALARQLDGAAILNIPDAEHFDVLFKTRILGPAIRAFLASPLD